MNDTTPRPCHWTHAHGPHVWYPAVADPDNPRVLHLFGPAASVICPGKGA